jgi:hypothetical protein
MRKNFQSEYSTNAERRLSVRAFGIFCSAVFLLSIFALAGCSLNMGSAPDSGAAKVAPEQSGGTSDAPSTARVEIIPLAQATGELSDVEIMWHIPTDPVEGFVVKYGFERSSINEETRILTKDLEQVETPQFGKVFRFVLGNIPVDRPLYISIAAFSGDKVSKASDIFEVKAEK